MIVIAKQDLELINKLSSRPFSNNTLSSNASDLEIEQLKSIIQKLKFLSESFKKKYDSYYGVFEASVTTGNPIAINGVKLKRIWSGIFKGSENKQYSAQISFVMNPEKPCLDVGFYFGRASAHSFKKEERIEYENQLKILGTILADGITNDFDLGELYSSLFDYGFHASVNTQTVLPDEWITTIRKNPKHSQVVYNIYPNSEGIIDFATIDFYVSMIIQLMNPIPVTLAEDVSLNKKRYKPLTAEQRAKQAERRTLIGEKGEFFAYLYEENKLKSLGIYDSVYPRHVALESTSFGYDILSLGEEDEVFIEVKSTTRLKQDPKSKYFNISTREYEFYKRNKEQFRLYRIYDIDGIPELEVLNMELVRFEPDSYRARIE